MECLNEVIVMLSIKKLKYLIKDEDKASKYYRKLGYLSMSNDEAKHKFFLSMQLKKREAKK